MGKDVHRRRQGTLAAALLLFAGALPVHAADAFGLVDVAERARALADKPYQPPPKVPAAAADIERVPWSRIDYRDEDALWHDEDLPFQVEFFHPGSFYDSAVGIHVIDESGINPVPFSKKGFVYPNDAMRQQVPEDAGYAGFRVHYPLNTPSKMDELVVFLGASYFRALGKGQAYGLSGRGLAIDTAMDSGEEFPEFREFWLVKPTDDARHITVYALLDSPSISGAYKFEIHPGEATLMNVESRLFARKPIRKLGVGALTSMFMFGENSMQKGGDWRPEMHDSDGMVVVDDKGEWLWRPLVNPRRLAVNSLQANSPQGFGLMQKDREFSHYQDLLDQYEIRPSVWITPKGQWGEGHVELVQIPSDSEQNDNVVSYWVPARPVRPGDELSFDYQMAWEMDRRASPSSAQVLNTLVGRIPMHENPPDAARRIAVDFAGGALGSQPDDARIGPKITVVGEGKVMQSRVVRNPHTNGWRLEFDVLPGNAGQPLELRAFLVDLEGRPLTETWSYALNQ
ncbi:MAG: glucan biosynthesis protein G [Salinisphaeraceae bacterium]|nr:glucan biosynthesis protein G [Salinisphaeraceae bacterium]